MYDVAHLYIPQAESALTSGVMASEGRRRRGGNSRHRQRPVNATCRDACHISTLRPDLAGGSRDAEHGGRRPRTNLLDPQPSGCTLPFVTSAEVIRALRADGWTLARVKGSHHHFRHPTKPGIVTVPHPRR